MYTGFFGLNEIPFSIAPNPHYLFMSERHKEALAHLTYGLGETGGFVLLTGEVGTGKTTVSRCLLEQLPEDTQAAFILNPTLSAQELLATICDELKIRYRKTGATLKTLTDKIQHKLLKNHEAGLNTILIIDEAQHLQPEVLEQLRLLTNLETHTKKLLQVILIGQPELQQLLKRRDLRQLAQRITARYHLLPLTAKEVQQYIFHRLQVAGCQRMLFSPAAIKQIHLLTAGIPRLINLVCDRALLGAYGLGKESVDKKIVNAASAEALGEEYNEPKIWHHSWFPWAGGTAAVVVLALIIGLALGNANSEPEELNTIVEQPVAIETAKINDAIKVESQSLPDAFSHMLTLWQVAVDESLEKPCEVASEYTLSCYWYKGTLNKLVSLNYPAVMKFLDSDGQSYYGTLLGKAPNDTSWLMQFGTQELVVDELWLNQNWQGSAVILWQAPKNFESRIDEKSPLSQIQWIENQLSYKQKRPARVLTKFDKLLSNQLSQYQKLNALEASAVADEATALMLSNTVESGLPKFIL